MSLIDIEIDGLTQSIVHAETKASLNTAIVWWHPLKPSQRRLTKWQFDWPGEASKGRMVAALTIRDDRAVQGLISFAPESDHVLVHLVESAPHNIGRRKRFIGVPGNLFALACQESLRQGFEGSLSFDAKTELISHYSESLGAIQVGTRQRMIITPAAAQRLIARYFKDTDLWPS